MDGAAQCEFVDAFISVVVSSVLYIEIKFPLQYNRSTKYHIYNMIDESRHRGHDGTVCGWYRT